MQITAPWLLNGPKEVKLPAEQVVSDQGFL